MGMTAYGNLPASSQIMFVNAVDKTTSPCGSVAALTLNFQSTLLLSSSSLDVNSTFAICYTVGSLNYSWDSGIRVRRSRAVRVSGHTVALFGSALGLRDHMNTGVAATWNMSDRVEPQTREMYPHFFSSTVLDPKTRVYRRVVGEPANLTLFDASIQRD